MKFNWVDLFLGLVLLASFVRGYKSGLLSALLSAIGYVLGGLVGLIVSMHFIHGWDQAWGRIGLIIAAVFFGAAIGEFLFRSSGKFLHKRVLFGPFKWLDSLAGAAFSVTRSLIIIYVITALLLVSPWGWAKENIPHSQIYLQIHKHAPNVLSKMQEQIKINLALISEKAKEVQQISA